MEHVWELFEEMDEMVYVSDVDTNTLVYMNRHLRQALGYHGHESYRGKMCYKVLQGCDDPCAFCNNDALRPGTFLSWSHKNPVLDKRFLIKDTMVEEEGRRYRIEIAIDRDAEAPSKSPYFYVRSETMLNECLQQVFSCTAPEDSIDSMLSYLGKTFCCDRSYVFEIRDGERMDNTYEWCAPGIAPQKDLLQNEALEHVDWWLQAFGENQVVVIQELEDIRTTHPAVYAALKPQGISALAVGPIAMDGQVTGFLGVDNPDSRLLPLLTPLLNVIGYFAATLIKRRDLLRRLHELSYHDQLTGALNRNALAEQYTTLSARCLGVLYCDVTGLKRVNDALGHEAGDQMLCHCYTLIRDSLGCCQVYRSGGDEFIVLCPGCPAEEFDEMVQRLRRRIRRDEYHVAVGQAWSDQQPLDLEQLIIQADQRMYRDKRDYYRANRILPEVEQRQGRIQQIAAGQPVSPFQQFLDETYYDAESLFQSVSQDNSSSYFYFGDMQRDLFYISDNMRDDFGFSSNVVPGLLRLWAKRISTPEFRELFWQDVSSILREKRTRHDLRYRVRDAYGNHQWIRCFGLLKWNEDHTAPLFFSGRVTHQDMSFVIDPISNLPREHTAHAHLRELEAKGEATLIIGFGLNGVAEINSTKGRPCGDRLLQKVGEELMDRLSCKMSFYRLEGVRCMAVVNPLYLAEGRESLVAQIRSIVQACYSALGLSTQNVCSFGVIEYPRQDIARGDLMEILVSLIRVARQESGQPFVSYSPESVRQIRQMSNMSLALRQDVDHHMEHFRIVVQPMVSAVTGEIAGGEVLLRWSFEGQDISPEVFIPLLEREGLIQQAGRWVFEQAVCTCVRVHAYHPTLYLTFNVSLYQLGDPQLLSFMRRTLETYQLDGSGLVAELTESCLDKQPDQLSHFVQACREMGISIALDDFGSGYSSIRMLLQYPFSVVKLDPALVQEVMESGEKWNFIRSIVFACHQFGKKVCVEGVEQQQQDESIRDTGCDLLQGYYYYCPMELHTLYRLLSGAEDQSEGGAGGGGRPETMSRQQNESAAKCGFQP